MLITHGPPYGIGDLTSRGEKTGCADLLEIVEEIKPRLHIFGHIHEGYGVTIKGEITYINASICNHLYQLTNEPIVGEHYFPVA